MNEEVRQWLFEKLESWLSTWDDLEGDSPDMLRQIVESLRNGNTRFTREAYNEILFHLWQIEQGEEDENGLSE